MDHNSAAWAIFDLKNDKIGFDGKMFEYADADISFGYGVRRDSFTVDMERVNGGVRFNFATNGAFGYENNNLEFVNIYLDMSKTTDGINWNFQNGKDINVRIYSDGTVYYRRNWSGAADELFWRLDHATYQYKLDGVAISHVNGVTTFSLTLTDEFLWGEEGTPESFRFQFRECADNDVNFNLYGGHKSNPFTGEKNLKGWIYWDESEWRPVMEEYLSALLSRFRNHSSIIAWDLWNEPGNSNRHDMSIPYLKRAFEIARSFDPVQPLTAGVWFYPEDYGKAPQADVEPIQRLALDLSDIVTFHQYENIERVKRVADKLKEEGRPMMNTEWLNRVQDNFIEDNLPLYHDKKIGSFSWGMVAGKSQHFLPWDELWQNKTLPLNRWQHDLFDTFHTPYDRAEIELMRRYGAELK